MPQNLLLPQRAGSFADKPFNLLAGTSYRITDKFAALTHGSCQRDVPGGVGHTGTLLPLVCPAAAAPTPPVGGGQMLEP